MPAPGYQTATLITVKTTTKSSKEVIPGWKGWKGKGALTETGSGGPGSGLGPSVVGSVQTQGTLWCSS